MARVVEMAERASEAPDGRISDVFDDDRQREGAYDLLESRRFETGALLRATAEAAARRCADEPFVFVSVDGSSLKLTDRTSRKDFGSVGTYSSGARGLKVISALAVSPHGIPLGLLDQEWWARDKRERRGSKSVDAARRRLEQRETRHWIDAIDAGGVRKLV